MTQKVLKLHVLRYSCQVCAYHGTHFRQMNTGPEIRSICVKCSWRNNPDNYRENVFIFILKVPTGTVYYSIHVLIPLRRQPWINTTDSAARTPTSLRANRAPGAAAPPTAATTVHAATRVSALESFPRLLQPIPVSAASAQHALASATQEMPSSATAIQAKATKVNPKTYTLERLQDKWLADRLNESVNWKRLHVDSADLSKSLVAAKQFYNLVTGPAGPIGGKGSSTDFSQEHPTSHSGNTSKSQVLLELLKQSEVLADNLDQLLGMLHSLEREAHAEGIGFSPRGWKLVQSTEEALGAAGAFAETLDDVASSDSSISLRGSSRLPATVLRLRSALGSFGSNPSARKLSDAIRAQQLADLLQGSSLRHLAARPLPKNGSESVSPAKEAVLS
ncbi:uncharacterized protein LOC34620454 [Cyclospora cayetanensis]|uniref:Uncharacterized protein LOC34620454 n=1 Tax=Cyclospora cayetanensis TaxID=88456 RepID=A0A6P6RRS3_9EIME|nr:uncharacterized protein LOC34620454 [Cyclospora cayetanensis]